MFIIKKDLFLVSLFIFSALKIASIRSLAKEKQKLKYTTGEISWSKMSCILLLTFHRAHMLKSTHQSVYASLRPSLSRASYIALTRCICLTEIVHGRRVVMVRS